MMMGKRYEEDTRYFAEMNKYKIKCKRCGHNTIIGPKRDKRICSWCGYYVYKDKKTEVKEAVMKLLKDM